MENTVMNLAQQHVLKLVSHIKTEKGLEELKDQLVEYYARKVDEGMEQLWDSGTWNEETLKNLKDAHYRTPYNE